jgi:HK97 family phage prohead protease/HK97 family phage major capsid protein
MENYLKNPIILAFHDQRMPVGKMVDHKVDEKGLWIKAAITDAAGDVYKLIKKGILSAFSIGFRVKDAEYKSEAEVFLIKDLELHEISVVSVPANQNTLFSLAKAFDSAEEYELFKQQFAVEKSAKGLDDSQPANSANKEEWNMDPKELEAMLAKAAAAAAEQTAKAVVEAQTKAALEAAEAAKAEAALEAKIKAAVAAVQTVDTGAERLLADVEKRLNEQAESHKAALEGLESALREKAAELEAIQKSRMQFTDPKGDSGDVSFSEKQAAVFISKITKRPVEETKYFKDLTTKYASGGVAGAAGSGGGAGGAVRLPSKNWETEISLNMEDEIRRQLVVAGTIRQIAMNQPFMKLPINPDAGADATWVANTSFGDTAGASSGTARQHALKEIEISAAKLATKEYVNFEEEEDGLIAIVPIIRDAIVRRMAKTLDKAMLIGNDVGATTYAAGISGLASYDALASASPTVAVAGKFTAAKFRDARRALGVWGLDPSELIMFVSQAAYYDLLDDTEFQSTDKISESRNTLITGQVGLLTQTRVLVSAQMTGAAANDALAVLVNPRNFVVGNYRAMRMDTDDEVVNQRRVMVASMRIAMSQLTSNEGAGVVTVRYA